MAGNLRQISSRAVTYRLFRPVDLSIVLSRYNFADAEKLLSRHIAIVPVGVPGLDSEFVVEILKQRRARIAARQKILAGEVLPANDDATIVNG